MFWFCYSHAPSGYIYIEYMLGWLPSLCLLPCSSAAHHRSVVFPRLVQSGVLFASAGMLEVCPAIHYFAYNRMINKCGLLSHVVSKWGHQPPFHPMFWSISQVFQTGANHHSIWLGWHPVPVKLDQRGAFPCGIWNHYSKSCNTNLFQTCVRLWTNVLERSNLRLCSFVNNLVAAKLHGTGTDFWDWFTYVAL